MAGSLDSAITTAQSGLTAMQSSMTVTARNVANLHTDGYSAKEAQLKNRVLAGQGEGVQMGEVQRRADASMLQSMRNAFSDFAGLDVKNPYFDRLSSLLGSPDSGTSVKDMMENFITSLSDLAHDPSLAGGQSELLSNVKTFVDALGDFSSSIQEMRGDADEDIGETVTQTNDLLDNISDLNQRIVRGKYSGDIGDLEDQRDQYLDQLSQLVDINYNEDQDGNMLVSTKSGMALVDHSVHHLEHVAVGTTNSGTTLDGGSIDGIYVGDRSPDTDITNDIRNGSLKGLIDLRDNILPDFQKQLDTFANSFKKTVNDEFNRGTPYPGSSDLEGQRNFIDAEHQSFTFMKAQDSKVVLTDENGRETRSISIRQLMSLPSGYGENPGETYPPAGGWPDPLPSGGSMEDASDRIKGWLNSKNRGGAGLTGATVEWSTPRVEPDSISIPPTDGKGPSGRLSINLHTEFSKIGIIDVESSAPNAREAKINMYIDDDGNTATANKETTGFSSLFGFNNLIDDSKPHTQIETKALDPTYRVAQAGVVTLLTSEGGVAHPAGVFTIAKGQSLEEIAETFNHNKNLAGTFHAEVVRDGKLERLHIINDKNEEVVISDKTGAFTGELGAKTVVQDESENMSIRNALLTDPSRLSTGRMTFVAGQGTAGHYEIASGDGSVLEEIYQNLKNTKQQYPYAGQLHGSPMSPMSYLQSSISNIVQRMSTNEQTSAVKGQVMENIQDQVNNKRQVNLDEELQNLMRFQRSYTASAKILSTIQEMFTALENVIH